jgi:hypothetical protein
MRVVRAAKKDVLPAAEQRLIQPERLLSQVRGGDHVSRA